MVKPFIAAVMFLILEVPVQSATVSFCGEGNACICISWSTASGEFVEVRCPHLKGWTDQRSGWNGQDGTLVNSIGSWGGLGTMQDPTGDLPGTPLTGALALKVMQGVDKAGQLLQSEKCEKLFAGAPLSVDPGYLILEQMYKRNGEGVKAKNGKIPCDSSSVSAWTTCCDHTPIVFFCNGFSNLSSIGAGRKIIHEALHVAGQRENSSSSAGPGDPPNPTGIDSAVRNACE